MKYCTHCGKQIDDEAVICTGCGCSAENNKDVNKNAISKNSNYTKLDYLTLIFGILSIIQCLITIVSNCSNVKFIDAILFSIGDSFYLMSITTFTLKEKYNAFNITGFALSILSIIVKIIFYWLFILVL